MQKWSTIDDLVAEILKEYEAAIASGSHHEQAVARCAAMLAVHRDDIGQIGVSFGLAEMVLRCASAVIAGDKNIQ